MRGRTPRLFALSILVSLAAGCGGAEPVPLPEMPSRGQPVTLPDEDRRNCLWERSVSANGSKSWEVRLTIDLERTD